jgi:hypothetical protein
VCMNVIKTQSHSANPVLLVGIGRRCDEYNEYNSGGGWCVCVGECVLMR